MKSGTQQPCSLTTSKYCIKCIQKLINYEKRGFSMFLMMPHGCFNYFKNLYLKNIYFLFLWSSLIGEKIATESAFKANRDEYSPGGTLSHEKVSTSHKYIHVLHP